MKKKSTLLSKYRKCNIFFAKSFLDCDGKTKSVDNYINHGLKWRKKRFNYWKKTKHFSGLPMINDHHLLC